MSPNTTLALLAHLKVLDHDKAEALAERINKGLQPARYKDAVTMIKEVFNEVDKHK